MTSRASQVDETGPPAYAEGPADCRVRSLPLPPARLALSLVAWTWLAGSAAAAPSSGLTEPAALAAFLREGPGPLALTRRLASAEGDWEVGRVLANPILDLAREQVFTPSGPTEQQRVGLSAEVPVLGQRAARLGVTDAQREIARIQIEADLAALAATFRAGFLAAQQAEALEAELQRAVATLRTLEVVVERRRTAGEGSGYDVLRLRLARAEAEARLLDAQAQARAGRAQLAGWLGHPVVERLHAPSLAGVPPAQGLQATQQAQHPALRLARAEVTRARAELALAWRTPLAEPQLSVGLKQTNEPTVQGLGYTAGLAWPLPLLNVGRAQVVRAEASLARAEAEERVVAVRLAAELTAARDTLAARLAHLERHAREVGPAARRVPVVARRAYEEGEQGIVALIDAHLAALEAETQAIKLRGAAWSAQLELDRATGLSIPPFDARRSAR